MALDCAPSLRPCPACGEAWESVGNVTALCRRGHGFRITTLLATAGPSGPIRQLPDSRSLAPGDREGPVGPVTAPIRVWEQAEPEPRPWAIPGLVPDGATTIVYGDAGTGKTWLGIATATCIAGGLPWLGRPVERRAVLYLDAELDAPEFIGRAHKVARGFGLSAPPAGLHYSRLLRPLNDDRTIDEVGQTIRDVGAELAVLDSISIAAAGADLAAPAEMTRLMNGLRGWGTVLALDHSPKPQAGVSQSALRPFGSQFKYAVARSVIQIVTNESGKGVILRPTKSNFGAKAPPVGIGIAYHADRVTFEAMSAGDDAFGEFDSQLPALERVAHVLARYPDGVSPRMIAEELAMAEKTTRNHLTALRSAGRAEALGDGQWLPLVPDS